MDKIALLPFFRRFVVLGSWMLLACAESESCDSFSGGCAPALERVLEQTPCTATGYGWPEDILPVAAAVAESLSTESGDPVFCRRQRIATILQSVGEGGYGDISRLQMSFGRGSRNVSVIVKRVHPKAEANIFQDQVNLTEHRRFLQSFVVEAAAYAALAGPLAVAGVAIPRLVASTPAEPVGLPFVLVLEDVSDMYPRGSFAGLRQMAFEEQGAALEWLAGMHAAFWETSFPQRLGLWQHGSYWTFDELAQLEMAGVPAEYSNRYLETDEVARLRRAAPAIGARLAGKRAGAQYQNDAPEIAHRTVIHGDAKPENILCSETGGKPTCAGLDFSWTGGGYGMCDVAYSLWGVLATNHVEQHLLNYHSVLINRLGNNKHYINNKEHAVKEYSVKVMRDHFDLCVADFMRWMIGFRKLGSDHFWAMPWAVSTLRSFLDRLDGGAILPNEKSYASAVNREFPLVEGALSIS